MENENIENDFDFGLLMEEWNAEVNLLQEIADSYEQETIELQTISNMTQAAEMLAGDTSDFAQNELKELEARAEAIKAELLSHIS